MQKVSQETEEKKEKELNFQVHEANDEPEIPWYQYFNLFFEPSFFSFFAKKKM